MKIIPFESKYKDDFVRLTRLWLSEYFWIEPSDEVILADPYRSYIETGGEIFIALDEENDLVAGVCALVFHPDEDFWEMSKLCVNPEYRRQGVAEQLIDKIIRTAKERGATKLYLDTSKKLEAAVRLYHRKGFIDIPLKNSHYQRTDMQMVKKIVPDETESQHHVLKNNKR